MSNLRNTAGLGYLGLERTKWKRQNGASGMKLCDLTLGSPQENLACDEALLDLCEEGASDELLRLWEPTRYFAVVGYANHVATEVNLSFCQRHGIPVLRRCSGGGTVLQGPGCLNYSLILRINDGPHRSIAATNEYVLRRHQAVLGSLLQAPIEACGQTDLAIGGLKFCGNAQRRRRNFLLFHGCFLLRLDISLVEKALPMPSRQPDYRAGRTHSDFLVNLNIPIASFKEALGKAWNAHSAFVPVPFERIALLVHQKYGRDDWNLKF